MTYEFTVSREATFRPVMRISSTHVLKRTGLWTILVPTYPHRDGPAPAVPVAYRQVGGLATAFYLTESRRAQSGGLR